ncbi:MAG: putative transrane protein, partial [Verrucomicrobiales bacterium]|nr:putative transrane protein [Verrucomicrobiales bacterium]
RFRNPEDAAVAQILFICGDEAKRMADVTAALGSKPVLTICDAPGNGQGTQGCMIALFKKQNAVRIRINVDRARAAGLTISSKLLHFAEIAKSD